MISVGSTHHLLHFFLTSHVDVYISEGTELILCNYEMSFLEITVLQLL